MAGFTVKKESPLQVLRKVQKASNMLGLGPGNPTADEVREHYRLMVKAMHPDSSEMNMPTEFHPMYTIEELRQAKDYIVKYLEDQDG